MLPASGVFHVRRSLAPSIVPRVRAAEESHLMVKPVQSPFFPDPKARASMIPGTLYAVDGGDGQIYFGQVTPTQWIGFFRHRSIEIGDLDVVVSSPVMCRFGVAHRSIGQAVRLGKWRKLGNFPMPPTIAEPTSYVLWPVGSSQVSVCPERS